MSLDAPSGTAADLVEEWTAEPVLESTTPFEGIIFDVVRERVDLGAGGVVTRDFVTHPGAVAVLALRERGGVDQVLMIRQYRHASGGHVWELPAGLLDVDGEPPWEAAARELAEEVDLTADEWHVLADDVTSPGAFPETVRIFLARGLHEVRGSRRAPAHGGGAEPATAVGVARRRRRRRSRRPHQQLRHARRACCPRACPAAAAGPRYGRTTPPGRPEKRNAPGRERGSVRRRAAPSLSLWRRP